METKDILQRVIDIYEGGNGAEFARKIGVDKSTISQIRHGRQRINAIIPKILAAYPEVSAEFLQSGEGCVTKSSVEHLQMLLRDKELEVENLRKELEMQRRVINHLLDSK